MIPLEYVGRLNWNAELGQRLKALRGKTSRRQLALRLKYLGHDCSHQNLQKVEEAKAQTVPLDLILGICKALGASIGDVLPVVQMNFPESLTIRRWRNYTK